MSKKSMETLDHVGNGAEDILKIEEPYVVSLTIEGSAALLFHRWDCDSIEAKSVAKKGSKAKKSDDVNSYVWRNAENALCVPGEYLRQAIITAAKFSQDPRSPRKSAMDLFKAGVMSLTELASLGTSDWDYLDRRRVMVQRNGITRMRPAMMAGWKASFDLQVFTPEYIDPTMLHEVIIRAGRLVGIGDFRPTYGRFQVTAFERIL